MELLSEIWQTTRRNKLRTGLTGFAVAWGIFMLIVLLGAGNGLINAQMSHANRFLSNSMMVFNGWTTKPYQGLKEGRYVPLKDRDLATTESNFTDNIDEVGAIQSQYGLTISYGQQYISNGLDGVYPNHTLIEKKEMLYGRFINKIDLQEKRKVIVLGNKQAAELVSSQETLQNSRIQTLIGKYVKVDNFAFRVVGIYKQDENGDPNLYVPYTTLKEMFGKGDEAGRIEFTFHGLVTQQQNEQFERDYKRRIGANHQVAPDDEDAFWIWNRYTQSMQMQDGINIIRTALWIVGLFTLLSGIVGVSNIMLIAVKERTHEFGIRKAIGAKPWSILRLIIIESIIITTIFGYIGMLLGIAANEYMNATIGNTKVDAGLFKATVFVDPTVGIDVCIEATLVMIIAGTFAGLIPAMKAARIRPIEALRAE
ncbi:ABC transporter permease [Prevotella sp. E9-3]|uniref:ABC transporter permease n=1 Tax=Prevotella sp. E9-3 TaxID=2913621 RepID=UPI001EDC4F60|nr:ABC transporter permease [Prevotella sp. E9-3]UKK48842.1 ABC transporter permease [Prevotella sp. E9-3]